MTDALEKVEEAITELRGGPMTEAVQNKLQRLYLRRERLQEKEFKASIARRARRAK